MVFESFIEILVNGSLKKHVFASLIIIFKGFIISFSIALVLSLFSLIFKEFDDYFDWAIQFMRNVPPLSLIPLLILWAGIGDTTKLIIIILASFFPMYLNISKGFRSASDELIEVGKAFYFTDLEIFFKIRLPAAVPDILLGMRIGLGYSYRAIIGAEMIASSVGLGYMINFARSLSKTDVVIVGILLIGILGYLSDAAFKWLIEKKLRNYSDYGWD